MYSEQNLSDRALRARRRRAQREGKVMPLSPAKRSKTAASTKRDNDDRSFDSNNSRTKKSRTSSQPVAVVSAPRYKLRSSVARARASAQRDATGHSFISSLTATVTPAAPRRQIDFSTRLESLERKEEDLDLPTGVINVFPSKRVHVRCSCPSQPQRPTTASCCAAKQYVAEYGKENLDYLQAWEEREFPQPPKGDDNSSVTSSVSIDVDDLLEKIVKYSSASSGGVADAKFLETGSAYLENQPFVTPRMRAVLVSWLVEVCVEFSISDSAFHAAISILDSLFRQGPTKEQYREMLEAENDNLDSEDDDDDDEKPKADKYYCVRKNELQALGCACTWMGSKLEDKSNPRQEDFSFISDYSVTTHQLRKCEIDVFKQLNFSLHRLTPLHFLNPFLLASVECPCRNCEYENPLLREMMIYLLSLARLPAELIKERPSLVTAAALYLARATLGIESQGFIHKYWSKTLVHYTGYQAWDLTRPVLLIYQYQLQAEQLGVAAYDKFKKDAHRKVALVTAKRVEDLDLPQTWQHHEMYDLISLSDL